MQKPGDEIKRLLSERGWTQEDLARILDRPLSNINWIIKGKTAITPKTAIALGAAFGSNPEMWLQLEAKYRLSLADSDSETVGRRARLHDYAPIKDMEKRGWISKAESAEDQEAILCKFFEVNSISDEPILGAVTRKSNSEEPLTPHQRAWCFRVRNLAKRKRVAQYKEDRIDSCLKELRKIAAYPQETHKVPSVLESHGLRFVIVEPLQWCKVDGVAMWLDDASPVIGVSCRYDRVDSFWFTLCHELSHIRHRDEAPLDSDLTDSMDAIMTVKNATERRADEEAADMLIPKEELESFIKRIGPLYSKDDIVRFAHRMKIHPGIIVGQLQHRKEIGYSSNREMLSKIRKVVTPAATTDGWGHSIKLG